MKDCISSERIWEDWLSAVGMGEHGGEGTGQLIPYAGVSLLLPRRSWLTAVWI